MSKPLATKVSTPLSKSVQIGPKVSQFCVAAIIFQHCLNPLGHGVHQSFKGCHWSPLPLLHDVITELVDVRDRALLHLPFEDAPQITFTLSFFRKAVVILEVCWGRYHVEILPCGPVSEGRGSCSASVCHSTQLAFIELLLLSAGSTHAAPDHDTPTTMLDCRQDTLVFVLLTWLPPHKLDTI